MEDVNDIYRDANKLKETQQPKTSLHVIHVEHRMNKAKQRKAMQSNAQQANDNVTRDTLHETYHRQARHYNYICYVETRNTIAVTCDASQSEITLPLHVAHQAPKHHYHHMTHKVANKHAKKCKPMRLELSLALPIDSNNTSNWLCAVSVSNKLHM